jgi:hypothetical protein
MNLKAMAFIISRTDLSHVERNVANVFAFHADRVTAIAWPSMPRVAREAGLKSVRSAQKVTRRLQGKQILSGEPSLNVGGRSNMTRYAFPPECQNLNPVPSDGDIDGGSLQKTPSPETRKNPKPRPQVHETLSSLTGEGVERKRKKEKGDTSPSMTDKNLLLIYTKIVSATKTADSSARFSTKDQQAILAVLADFDTLPAVAQIQRAVTSIVDGLKTPWELSHAGDTIACELVGKLDAIQKSDARLVNEVAHNEAMQVVYAAEEAATRSKREADSEQERQDESESDFDEFGPKVKALAPIQVAGVA